MRFLISNDDGIHSRGLALLSKVAQRFGYVHVVAPETERSSASHSISSTHPLKYQPTDPIAGAAAHRVNGTPADCVALGMHHEADIDVVLSGVNHGPNLGNGLWHSGTLAAAHQAALLGARGIAFSSLATLSDEERAGLAPHIERVLNLLLPRTDMRLINVNLPPRPRGIRWVRQAVEQYDGEVVRANDPYDRPVFWLAVTKLQNHARDTDLWAFERGWITITPVTLELTDRALLPPPDASDSVVEFEGAAAAATKVRVDSEGSTVEDKKKE